MGVAPKGVAREGDDALRDEVVTAEAADTLAVPVMAAAAAMALGVRRSSTGKGGMSASVNEAGSDDNAVVVSCKMDCTHS